MKRQKDALAKAAFLLLCILSIGLCQADEFIDRAKALMSQGKAAEAYALLEPLEDKRAGEIDFDYLFGTAALDSGKPDRATIAFERVLSINPNFAGARLDLARAYFTMGSDDLAKNEFETVQSENPPANVKTIITQYLAAIEARKKKARPSLVGYVETGGGTDNNVTAVSSNFTGGVLQAYNIPGVQPTGNSIARSGSFSQFAAGADYTHPFELDTVEGVGAYLGGDLRERRYYNNNTEFNYQQFDARGGLSWSRETDLFKVGLQTQRYYQEGATPLATNGTRISNDRTTRGYTGEWRHALAPGRQVSLFAQFNQQRFYTNPSQNINQGLYGGQFVNAWEIKGKPVLALSAFKSRDRALGPSNVAGTTDVSKVLTGLRAYGQYSIVEKVDLFLSIGNTEREDSTQFSRSLVLAYAKDRTFDTNLGFNWRIRPEWTLRAQQSVFDNRSNLTLYDYKRRETSVFLRRDFK